MSHPTELLAAYVDGSLSAEERDRVEAHLATCRTCREEVGLARAVLPALAALDEEPVPMGVTRPVVDKVGGARSWSAEPRTHRRSGRRTKVSVALGGAAAASIAIVLAITLSGGTIGQMTAGPAGGDGTASGAAREAAPGNVRLEKQDRNYDETSLRQLADAVARPALDTAAVPPAPTAKVAFGSADPAVGCLRRAGASFSAHDRPIRLIQARFEGTPAYLGVFVEGPTGKEPDHVAIWVVATSDCRILRLVSEPR